MPANKILNLTEEKKAKLLRGLKKDGRKPKSDAKGELEKQSSKPNKTAVLGARKRRQPEKEITYEVTYNVAKEQRNTTRKYKAPKTLRDLKRYARKLLATSDVRIDPELNKFVWQNGMKNPPRRLRLRLARKHNQQEGKENKYYVQISNVIVDSFDGLHTKIVTDEQQ